MSGSGNQPPGGTPPGVAADQSMEDILASIRRILNEDEAATPAETEADATPSAEPSVAAPAEPEPLLLTEDMMVSEPEDSVQPEAPPQPPPASAPAPAHEAPAPAEAEPGSEPALAGPPAPAAAAAAAGPDALLAPAVAAAAAASVGQLLRAVSTERSTLVHRSGPSIEDVVREELRPLLKDWLDQHLPAIVERLVRSEIERVVGSGLG